MDPADETSSAGLRLDSGLAAVELALISPILLMLIFGIIIYSIYFAICIGVAQEGARAAVAGLSQAERQSLATAAANDVLSSYGTMIDPAHTTVTAVPSGSDPNRFVVTVTYDMSSLGFAGFADFVPLPTTTPSATSTVANGSY